MNAPAFDEDDLSYCRRQMAAVWQYLNPNASNDMEWADEIIIAIDHRCDAAGSQDEEVDHAAMDSLGVVDEFNDVLQGIPKPVDPAADHSEAEEFWKDMAKYGTCFSLNGKRIDPANIYIDVPAERAEGVKVVGALDALTQYSAEHGHPADFEHAISILSRLAADASIGRRWNQDSSLETWFPYTAQELETLRRLAAEQGNGRKDAERLAWLLRRLPGCVLYELFGMLSDTADLAEFRGCIEAAMAQEAGNG